MDVSGWPAIVALAAPIAALLLAIVMFARPRRGVRAGSEAGEIATGRYGASVPARLPGARSSPARPSPDTPVSGKSSPQSPVPRAEPPTAPPAKPLDEIVAAMTRAEEIGDERALATLYLARARHALAIGDLGEAGDKIRRSIRIASRLGLKDVHAAGRLELGDMAHASGDLTTACEHWQLARGLYFDVRKTQALEAVEARMQQNGCPTDWVLNDF